MADSSFDVAIQKLRNWRRRSGVGLDFILPGLALGGLKEALNEEQLLENRISAIVSIHDFHSEHKLGEFFRRLRIKLSDRPEEEASAYFSEVNSFIHSARLRGESVLVHCVAGVSRSVCFMAAYLMTVTNLDYAGTLAYIGSKRAGANPNVGFRMQLMKFADQQLAYERERLSREFDAESFADRFKEDCLLSNSAYLQDLRAKPTKVDMTSDSGAILPSPAPHTSLSQAETVRSLDGQM